MAARFRVKEHQGLKHCLAFLLRSLLLLTSSFWSPGLGSLWELESRLQPMAEFRLTAPPPLTHSLTHRVKMQAPPLSSGLASLILPSKGRLRARSSDGERPREGDRESQVCADYLEGRTAFFPPVYGHCLAQSRQPWPWNGLQ